MSRPIARIIATGSYLPSRVVTNHDLVGLVDTTDEWIRSRTGILERRMAADGEMTSDLAVAAARQALADASLQPGDMDLILVATTTPDLIFPATAALVQYKLGAHPRHMPAFDLQAVCTGFIYGLEVAQHFIASGHYRRVLVIGAETFSRILDWQDRTTCVLFGDGAGAAILEAVEPAGNRGILSTHIHADGSHADLLKASGGVSMGPPTQPPKGNQGIGSIIMRGNEVFKQAVTALGRIVDETLAAHHMDRSHIDWLVPHQANIRIIQSTAKKLDMSLDRVVITVDRHGNTSAASVPLALDVAVRDGRIQPGHLVLLEAFGGGFTWGSALLRW